MQKTTISILLTALIAITGTYLFLKDGLGDVSDDKTPITYGTFCCFLTGQESITYPLIFSDIRVFSDHEQSDTHQEQPSVIFDGGYKDFEVSMNVVKTTKKKMDDTINGLAERNTFFEGVKLTTNGYEGKVFSNDERAHPIPDSESCSFGYGYLIPLAESDDVLALGITVVQRSWENSIPCSLFDDENYLPLKGMVDRVIADIKPAF